MMYRTCLSGFVVGVFLALISAVSSHARDTYLTVYNKDLALVREVETLTLKKGVGTYSFTDVAAQIDPTSVRIRARGEPDLFRVLEQNYEYDLVSSDRIYTRYLDEEIRVFLGFLEGGELLEGRLVSTSGRDIIIKAPDGRVNIISRQKIQRTEFPKLPEGLITRPTLFWLLESEKTGKVESEISYLTGGLGWHAEYVAEISEDESHLGLSAWISVENNSGTSFKNTKLKLVAGDVHRVRREFARMRPGKLIGVGRDEAPVEERVLFEYHLYDVSRRTDLANNQVKQILMIPPRDVIARKIYEFRWEGGSKAVQVKIAFENREKMGLGIPLPAGVVRVFKKDVDETLQFVGEDRINHTPKDTEVRLIMGSAFDLTGERKVLDRKKITRFVTEEDIEITLKNRKEEAVEIIVVEKIYGFWEIIHSSPDYKKKDATTVEFLVRIPAGGEEKVSYRVRHQ